MSPEPLSAPDPSGGIVTAITAEPRKPGRASISVAGQLAGVVAMETVVRLGIRVGQALPADAVAILAEETAALRVHDRAVRLLAARPRSVRELRRRLLAAKEAEPHVDAAIQRLVESNLLDDAAYARQVARSQIVGRGHAPRRLQQELARRGVDRAVADRAIAIVLAEDAAPGAYGAEGGVDLKDTIERLARRKLQGLRDVDARTRERRLYAFLARRGYDSNDIRVVLSKLRVGDGEPDSA
jgi:regulatory protein